MNFTEFLTELKQLVARAEVGDGDGIGLPLVAPTLSDDPPFNLIPDVVARKAAMSEYIDGDVFVKTYWRRGDVAVMAGARVSDWERLWQPLSMQRSGYSIPLHLCVITPPRADNYDPVCSVGDLNWTASDIDAGKEYRYSPSQDRGTNMMNWILHGCPHVNSYGVYDDLDGAPARPDRWDEAFSRMRGIPR